MKALPTINTILFIICIPVLLITTNVRFAVNDIRLYEYGFNKYEVSETTGLDNEELKQTAQQLIDYFNSDEEFTAIKVFQEREVAHLKDVKGLIQLVYRLQIGTLVFILIYIIFNFLLLRRALWREIARRLVWGGLATIGLVAILGFLSLVGFDDLFLWFHLVSFRNDLWQLSPDAMLLLMFPQGFFNDAALFIAGGTLLEAALIGGIAWGFLRFRKEAESEPASSQE
jgi:integral membrane protein (TIGR01906 family)